MLPTLLPNETAQKIFFVILAVARKRGENLASTQPLVRLVSALHRWLFLLKGLQIRCRTEPEARNVSRTARMAVFGQMAHERWRRRSVRGCAARAQWNVVL